MVPLTIQIRGSMQVSTFRRKYFRVLVVTDSVGRLTTLSQTVARLTDRILRLTTVSELSHHGALASIWRRPGAHAFESLTGA